MAKKKKKVSSQNKNVKKAQKQKLRASKIAKQKANNSTSLSAQSIEEQCDAILELFEEGELKTAKNKLKKLNSIKIEHPFICFTNGIATLQMTGVAEAVQYFEKAVALDPLYVEAHFNLAVCYKELFQAGKMLSSFLKVVEIGDETDDLVISAKELLDSFQETLNDGDNVTLSDYIKGEELFTKAFSFLEQGNPEKALELFSENLKISPNHTQTHGNIGICYVKLGDKEKALQSFEKALEIDPTYQLAQINKEIILRNGIEDSQKERLESVDYYRDYGSQGRSYLDDLSNGCVKTK